MRSKKKGVTKRDLLAYIRGMARVNAVTEAERRQRLERMTPEEARALFTELIESGDRLRGQEAGLERIDEWRLETKLAVRRSFMRLHEEAQRRSASEFLTDLCA